MGAKILQPGILLRARQALRLGNRGLKRSFGLVMVGSPRHRGGKRADPAFRSAESGRPLRFAMTRWRPGWLPASRNAATGATVEQGECRIGSWGSPACLGGKRVRLFDRQAGLKRRPLGFLGGSRRGGKSVGFPLRPQLSLRSYAPAQWSDRLEAVMPQSQLNRAHFPRIAPAAERSNPRKTAAFLKRSFDEELGVLSPLRFRDVVLANGLPKGFPQCLELKDRQLLVAFLFFCTGVHNALPRPARF